MSNEIEAAGALVTAGLTAHEIDTAHGGAGKPPHGNAAHAHDHGGCRNCGAPLSGAYCHACGQAAHIHRSLLHLAEEVLHGVLHFDAKGWRTLPLLVARPGLLTRRYIDGQRMRYVSPLALFLFTVFLMFFAASFASRPPMVFNNTTEARAELQKAVEEARRAEAKAQAELERARARGEGIADAQAELVDAQAEVASAQSALHAVEIAASVAAAASAAGSGAASAPAAPGSAAAEASEPGWAAALRKASVRTGHPSLDAAIKHAADNPELTIYKLKNTAYKFSFMLVPISLPFLWLMFFWRRGIAMYDHAVFVLYSLSFMSLLFIVLALLGAAHWSSPIPWLAALAPPVHMAAQLRETYRLGIFSTLWRTFALLFVAGIVFVLFLLFIVVVTMG